MNQTAHNYTVQTAAKMLGIGSKHLFEILRNKKIIDHHNLPYQRYIDGGLLAVRTSSWRYNENDTGTHFYGRTMVTENGIEWLSELLQEEKNDGS